MNTVTSGVRKLNLRLRSESESELNRKHYFQGLRMNRTLLCLGLANNKIGDVGAHKFADVRISMALNIFVSGSTREELQKNCLPRVAMPYFLKCAKKGR